MENIFSYLKQLDLSDHEVALYLKLLETGAVGVRQLAQVVGVNRTSAYIYIDQLIEKGLVMKLVKGSKKMVAASRPEESLHDLILKKAQTVTSIQKNFPSILREIQTFVPRVAPVPDAEITYLKGIRNVKNIYREAFQGNEIRSYVKVEEEAALSPDNAVLFHTAFSKNTKLKMWEIIYESPISRRKAIEVLSENNRYFYKFMPSDLKWSITSEDIVMYDGKVAIINYAGDVSSIVLQSADFYNNSKELFNFIWKMIPNTGQ